MSAAAMEDTQKTHFSMPPFIYINGYPGVGKFTIAKKLRTLLPHSKVLDNHLLIDPAAAVFERTDAEYQPLRQVLRREVLNAVATSSSTVMTTWIFTDSQSSDTTGRSCSGDYLNAANLRGSRFISVILTCELEENLRRATWVDRREASDTKLTDVEIIKRIRDEEDILQFKDEFELELDVTGLSAEEAAERIRQHVTSCYDFNYA